MPEPAGRPLGWGTWDPRHPAAFVHLPSGLVVRVGAYSAAANAFTGFPVSADVRLGPHLPGGAYAELEVAHAGSRLRVRFAGLGEGGMAGDVEVLETAEWGLRFWYLLAVGFDPAFGEGGRVRLEVPGGEARYVDPPAVLGAGHGGTGAFALAVSERPVDAHPYERWWEAGREMEDRGYYARPPERPDGAWAVLRFNAVTRRARFGVGVGDDRPAALGGARAALAVAEEDGTFVSRADRYGRHRVAAVRDVVAWNTVWDPENRRPYTASTRAWVTHRFGGWIVWQVDAFFHALLAVHAGDADAARANVDAALSLATGQGNLAALMSGTTRWVDRSHPPVGAHACWLVSRALGDRSILERGYPVLARAHAWWFAARDGNGNGLLEYGSSPVGDGHFVHTKLAAMDESSNDNSPVHDEAVFDVRAHTLDVEDVGLNSLLVHEGELLARIADELGRPDEAAALRGRGAALAAKVREGLWDPERRVFANRRWDGAFVRSLAPTSFYPLLAGIATPEQARDLVGGWLRDPRRFGGAWPVAGTPHEDPASLDNVYWRGRGWPCFNYLVYMGLRRYRLDREATWLAERSAALFARGWAERRSYENWNQRTGEGGDSADTEPFYTWGALLPMLADLELIGIDPFDGLCFGAPEGAGSGERAAFLFAGDGELRVEVGEQGTTLFRERDVIFRADAPGRFRSFEWTPGRTAVEVPPVAAPVRMGALLRRPPRPASIRVLVDGEPGPDWSAYGPIDAEFVTPGFTLPPSDRPRRVELAGGP